VPLTKKQERILKKAHFTPEEDKVWVHAFNYFMDEEGKSEDEADELAWRDVQEQFPRLRKFKGAYP